MDKETLFMELYREKYGERITRELAEQIVDGFTVSDGSDRSSGEMWTYDEAKMTGDKIGINWEKVSKCEFYLVLNMMYSDYYRTGKKHGMTNDFYAELARDWFEDVDGKENKTFFYFINML